jgi:hypothetical protein
MVRGLARPTWGTGCSRPAYCDNESDFASLLGGRCGNQARPWLSRPSNRSGSMATLAAIRRALTVWR